MRLLASLLTTAVLAAPVRVALGQARATDAERCRSATSPAATVSACRSSLRGRPGDAGAHRALANALGLLGRREEALAELYEAARLVPTDAAVWDELALAAYALARYDEAVAYWERSRSLDRRIVDGSAVTRGLLARSRARLAAAREGRALVPALALERVGIGFPIADSGYVMTSAELIYRCPEVTLRSVAGDARMLSVFAVDFEHDLAVIKVEGSIPPALPFRGGWGVRGGEHLFALPFPADTSSQRLVGATADPHRRARERGRILRLTGDLRADRAGPLVDSEGRVVGVFGRLWDRSPYQPRGGEAPSTVNAAVDVLALRDFFRTDGVPHLIAGRNTPRIEGQREVMRGRSGMRVECRR